MRKSLVAAFAVTAAACVACSSATSPASAGRTDHTGTGSARPTTSRAPATLTVRWSPNMNWKHGETVVTRGTAAQGDRLLRAVRAAAKVPKNARYACPADFGVAARFRIGGERGAAELTGCRWVNYRHRSYWIDEAVTKDLRVVAPRRWLGYLGVTPKPKLNIAWTPNLNWKHGRTKITHGSAAQGHELLRDIRAARRVKDPGAFFCPADYGVTAKFWFNGKHGRADLGGCHFVTLGRTTYRDDTAIAKDLRALAPARWKQYFRANSQLP